MEENTGRRRLPNWLTMIVIALVAFAGGLGGIYLGTMVFRGGTRPVQANATVENLSYSDNSDFVNIQVGDLFPLEDVTDSSGHLLNMADLLAGQPSVFLFVSMECEPCFKLLEMWQKGIRERLNEDVQVFSVLQEPDKPVPIEYAGLLDGMHSVRLDLERWQELYSIDFWPTIISVDASGFVQHVQTGYVGFFQHGLLDDFVKPSG